MCKSLFYRFLYLVVSVSGFQIVFQVLPLGFTP